MIPVAALKVGFNVPIPNQSHFSCFVRSRRRARLEKNALLLENEK